MMLVLNGPVRKYPAALLLRPGNHKHPGLMLLPMSQHSTQHLAIHGHLFQRYRGAFLSLLLLNSCQEQDCYHDLHTLFCVTVYSCSGHGRNAGNTPGPVHLLLERSGTHVRPLRCHIGEGSS